MKTTRRKVKVIGKQEYIDPRTGQIREMNVIDIGEKDANFHKIWIEHILNSIDLIGNQKTKLAFWLINHLDKENKIVMTYRQIAQKSGMSYQTVYRTMNALIEANFISKINGGAYRINPEVVFKGGTEARMDILLQYNNEKADENPILEMSPQEKPKEEDEPLNLFEKMA